MTVLMASYVQILIIVTAFLFAITIHEYAHALSAYLLGDNTAQQAGRLTLNPFAHVDFLGLICLLIFHIGWAAPVPMDERNFRYPRLYSVICGFAGPIANLLVALISLYGEAYVPPLLGSEWSGVATMFFKLSAWVNVMLAVFNLIPLPPLDGSHLVRALMPERWLPGYYAFMRFSFLILLAFILFPATQELLLDGIEWTQELLERFVI